MAWQDAHRAKSNAVAHQVPTGRVLDESFWLRFGPIANPTMRERIIFVTIDDVGRVGAATFNVKLVCDALGVSYSLINHHFGSRDELIAEAASRWYEIYVEALWQAVCDAEQTPEARFRAWLAANVSWSGDFNGMSALLDYPTASSDVTQFIDTYHRADMTSLGELNLARLVSLVRDVRMNEIGTYSLERGKVDRDLLLNDPQLTLVAGAIAWAILGMSVWTAGHHLPTTQVEGVDEYVGAIGEFYFNSMVELARRA
ncbi:MAG: hypothetical protein RLZZ600_1245 [Actinomycetota bacterium]|jgi:AcrR family transcriptional regulator